MEVLYGGRVLCTMQRLRGGADHRIDYRHVIGSLVRKPGAFARYRFREGLFPSLTYRAAYDALGRTHGKRADVEYVRLLHLAATTGERRSWRRFVLDSTPATRATTPACRPRCVRRFRRSLWSMCPASTWHRAVATAPRGITLRFVSGASSSGPTPKRERNHDENTERDLSKRGLEEEDASGP